MRGSSSLLHSTVTVMSRSAFLINCVKPSVSIIMLPAQIQVIATVFQTCLIVQKHNNNNIALTIFDSPITFEPVKIGNCV